MQGITFDWFQWYRKNRKLSLAENLFLRCSEKKTKKDQKVIFYNKRGKHLTISMSDKFMEAHVNQEDKQKGDQRKYKPLMFIDINALRRHAESLSTLFDKKEVKWVPFNEILHYNQVLLDMTSERFLQRSLKNTYGMEMLPDQFLYLKKTVYQLRRRRSNFVYAYDLVGHFRGLYVMDHQRGGALFLSRKALEYCKKQVFDEEDFIQKTLSEFPDWRDDTTQRIWERWMKLVERFSAILARMRHMVL